MAVEGKRGCGYRRVGGLYLVGEGMPVACDRLPLPILVCETCGEHLRFSRNIAKINPQGLWGRHLNPASGVECGDRISDVVCFPGDKAYLMWVGSEYTPQSFVTEAGNMGVSKRIPAIPADLKVGEDWVFLAYLKLIPTGKKSYLLPFNDPEDLKGKKGFEPGIFYAFRPTRLEMIVTKSQSQDAEKMKLLRVKGIVLVIVPDDDPDHAPRRKKGETPIE